MNKNIISKFINPKNVLENIDLILDGKGSKKISTAYKLIDETFGLTQPDKIIRTCELLKEYSNALIKHGYGLSRRDLKQKDLIDMRAYTKKTKTEWIYQLKDDIYTQFKDYEKTKINYFYEIIPCFNEGSFYMADDTYLYWKILDLKPSENTITLRLISYAIMNTYWSVGMSCVATLKIDGPANIKNDIAIDINEKESYSMVKLYKSISYSELKWSKSDIKLWKENVITMVRKKEESEKQKGNTPFKKLLKIYLDQVSLLNFILANNKAKAVRNKTNNSKNVTIKYENVKQPKKK